jgi:hypothetical protein
MSAGAGVPRREAVSLVNDSLAPLLAHQLRLSRTPIASPAPETPAGTVEALHVLLLVSSIVRPSTNGLMQLYCNRMHLSAAIDAALSWLTNERPAGTIHLLLVS